MTVSQLQDRVRDFVAARSWERFHNSKNLAMAIASEAGELCSLLRWIDTSDLRAAENDQVTREKLSSEIGDIGILLLAICNRLEFKFSDVVADKLVVNERNYPVEDSIGVAERSDRRL